jgi:hypothetical protein
LLLLLLLLSLFSTLLLLKTANIFRSKKLEEKDT